MLKVNYNGASSDEFENKFSQFIDEPVAEAEPELIRLYQTMTNFKAHCAYCIYGRKLFVKGLQKIREGEQSEGLLLIKRAFDHAAIKNQIVGFLGGFLK